MIHQRRRSHPHGGAGKTGLLPIWLAGQCALQCGAVQCCMPCRAVWCSAASTTVEQAFTKIVSAAFAGRLHAVVQACGALDLCERCNFFFQRCAEGQRAGYGWRLGRGACASLQPQSLKVHVSKLRPPLILAARMPFFSTLLWCRRHPQFFCRNISLCIVGDCANTGFWGSVPLLPHLSPLSVR